MNGHQWFVRSLDYNDQVDLLMRIGSPQDGPVRVAEATIELVEKRPGEVISRPTLSLGRYEAQQIMDGLWREGFRPRDGAGSLAHVEAQKAHLEDMRRLVFTEKEAD